MDAAWLERVALRHVERWEATREGVRRVLERRIRRRCGRTGESPDEALGWIEDLLPRLEARGYVDDRRFAAQLLRRMRRQGRSRAQIRGRLRKKGVPSAIASECLAEDRGEDELEAAWQAARKRRLGPYCCDPERREAERERHLAILGRRGFSFEIARQVVEARDLPEPG